MFISLGYRNTQGLRLFLEKHPKASGGLIVYGGKEMKQLNEKIAAIPWPLTTGQVMRYKMQRPSSPSRCWQTAFCSTTA
jgi:hypothetical protein